MDNKASVNAYRMGRYPMPWLHAVVEEADQDAVVSKFEVASFPWPILVDAAGRILGLGPDLRNKSLPEVLDGVLASDAR